MHYLNYHNALWDCFGFHIAQIGKMIPNQAILPNSAISPGRLPNQAILPDSAIGPDWSEELFFLAAEGKYLKTYVCLKA